LDAVISRRILALPKPLYVSTKKLPKFLSLRSASKDLQFEQRPGSDGQ
jgi:hypothetical protein